MKDPDELWYHNFTREHYDAAVEYLRNLDEVLCVKTCDGNAYQGGELWVHTNYLNERIVDPLITHLDMEIRGVIVAKPHEHLGFNCVNKHGTCVELNMAVYTPCNPCEVDAFKCEFSDKAVWWESEGERERFKIFDASFD